MNFDTLQTATRKNEFHSLQRISFNKIISNFAIGSRKTFIKRSMCATAPFREITSQATPVQGSFPGVKSARASVDGPSGAVVSNHTTSFHK